MSLAGDRGTCAENLVAAYLELAGWRIEARNHRLAGVEVDLIAGEGRTRVLVEVKYRGRTDYGGAAAAVDGRKRERLRRAAAAAGSGPVRIDVVTVEPEPDGLRLWHYRNAVTA